MSLGVLIIQSNLKSAQPVVDYFAERGERVFLTENPEEASSLAARGPYDLAVVDLNLPPDGCPHVLQALKQYSPNTAILFTTDQPAQKTKPEPGAHSPQLVLHQPFTRSEIEKAVEILVRKTALPIPSRRRGPRLRVPVRVKIALPFAILALFFAIAAALMSGRVVMDTMEERYTNQLIESGKVVSDWMVRQEDRQLRTWRLLAYTQGVADAVAAEDAERIRALTLPIAVNEQAEAIEILNRDGTSVLSLRHASGAPVEDYSATRGTNAFAEWPFVDKALQNQTTDGRDKYAGLAQAPWGDYFYIAGPLLDAKEQPVGAILVGKSLNSLVRQIRADTLTDATIYSPGGQPLASTLPWDVPMALPLESATHIAQGGTDVSFQRDLSIASVNYGEIVGPLTASDQTRLGALGVAIPQTLFVRTSQVTRFQIFVLVAVAILFVIGVGIFLADRITHPLSNLAQASLQVAQGNLHVQVDPTGNDEIADLANSFRYMMAGLREGSMYRDLLGRTVSPEVRERMREAISSGRLRLQGQDVVASVLFADIRGFTTLAEKHQPNVVLGWLNEYFGEIVPIIAEHNGVVNKFDGDAVLAFFGILPVELAPQESAEQACRAALAMLATIERINARRAERGEPPFITGIGVSTGPVTAGGLGTADRLNYTIIGDTVNTANRLQELTRSFGASGIVVSEPTRLALGGHQSDFVFESLGAQLLRDKEEPQAVSRLWAEADR